MIRRRRVSAHRLNKRCDKVSQPVPPSTTVTEPQAVENGETPSGTHAIPNSFTIWGTHGSGKGSGRSGGALGGARTTGLEIRSKKAVASEEGMRGWPSLALLQKEVMEMHGRLRASVHSQRVENALL